MLKKIHYCFLFFMLIITLICSCSHVDQVKLHDGASGTGSRLITVQITMLEYCRFAFHSEIEGLGDKWYEGTRVMIVMPDKMVKEVVIVHPDVISLDSPWRKIGAVFTVQFPAECMQGIMFSDCIKFP